MAFLSLLRKRVLIIGITLLLFSSFRLSPVSSQIMWSDDFEDNNLEDWELASFWMECASTCPWVRIATTVYVENGELVLDSTGINDVHTVWALHDSNLSYGLWSYDMTMHGVTHDAFGISMTDLDNGFNLTEFDGMTTVSGNITGYVVFTVNYRNSGFDALFPTPGIAIFKFLPNGSPNSTQDDSTDWLAGVSMADIGMSTTGSYHFDVYRQSNGNLTVYVDGKSILSIIDNEYSTGQKSGVWSWDGKTSYDNLSTVGPEGNTLTTESSPNQNDKTGDDEKLPSVLKMPKLDTLFIAGLFVSIGGISVFYGYTGLKGSNSIFPKTLGEKSKKVIISIFGKYFSSYILIGQNIAKRERFVSSELYPKALLQHKFLMHPIRLAMGKLLSETVYMISSELRNALDIPWNDYSAHTKGMSKKGFINIEEKFIDGQAKQIITLLPKGLNEYNALISNLIEFIENSPVYDRFIDDT